MVGEKLPESRVHRRGVTENLGYVRSEEHQIRAFPVPRVVLPSYAVRGRSLLGDFEIAVVILIHSVTSPPALYLGQLTSHFQRRKVNGLLIAAPSPSKNRIVIKWSSSSMTANPSCVVASDGKSVFACGTSGGTGSEPAPLIR